MRAVSCPRQGDEASDEAPVGDTSEFVDEAPAAPTTGSSQSKKAKTSASAEGKSEKSEEKSDVSEEVNPDDIPF